MIVHSFQTSGKIENKIKIKYTNLIVYTIKLKPLTIFYSRKFRDYLLENDCGVDTRFLKVKKTPWY